MAHFAEIDSNLDNVVLRVLVIGNEDILDENGEESEALGIAFCKSLFGLLFHFNPDQSNRFCFAQVDHIMWCFRIFIHSQREF